MKNNKEQIKSNNTINHTCQGCGRKRNIVHALDYNTYPYAISKPFLYCNNCNSFEFYKEK